MKNSNQISSSAVISNSILGTNVRVYRNASVKHSTLGDDISIGDESIIIESNLAGNNTINRRNLVYQSKLGRYTYTGVGTQIRAVEIGKFCSISWYVSLGGKNHNYKNVTNSSLRAFSNMDTGVYDSEYEYGVNQAECKIDNDVWISAGAIILRGVTIGNGAVIGAGAVVTKDVEPYSIVAGVPAKKIKMRFDDNVIESLEDIKWWDWPIDVIRNNLSLIYKTEVDGKVLKELIKIAESLKALK